MVPGNDKVDPDKLTRFSAKALERLGVPAGDAVVVARILVACDLRGVESHGVAHLRTFYARRIRNGLINLDPKPQLFSRSPATAVMDGDNGLGFVIGHKAMTEAVRRAGDTGAGFVAVRNSTHFGAGAYYAMMALEHDMIGLAMTNSVASVVAPGSAVPAVGTNPLAVAVPAGRYSPLVLDMATSAVAAGHIEKAARAGLKSIPEGWLVDDQGKSVTEIAGRVRGKGGLLPLGGKPETGGYKGFGLALVVDVLCGILSGATASILRKESPEARGNAGDHFFGAFRIDSFTPVEEFKESMDSMMDALETLPTVPGVDKVSIPGVYEAGIVRERQENGIPLDSKVVEDLNLLAEELGIEYAL